MPSAGRTVLVCVAALTLLSGCAQPPAAPPSSPTSMPTASPTPTASATPTPSPTPTPTAAPVATATPPASASAAWPRCADGVVIDPEGAYTVSWQGTYEERIAASNPSEGFEPADLLDSDAVLCAVVYDAPVDGPGAGVGRFSTAIVRDAEVLASAQAWAAEHGYEPLEPAGQQPEYVLEGDDGMFDARLQAFVLGDPIYGRVELEGFERRSGLDLEPTDVLLTHVSFEAPQG
jgi:hypothetical protein